MFMFECSHFESDLVIFWHTRQQGPIQDRLGRSKGVGVVVVWSMSPENCEIPDANAMKLDTKKSECKQFNNF